MPDELVGYIVDLKRDEAIALVKGKVDQGEDPLIIMEECRCGMTTVGDRFQQGDYYLAELMLSAEIFKAVAAILEPHLAKVSPEKPRGKVILATMKGDIHDLGKNIVATLLRAHSFEVHDLGVDVPPAVLFDSVKLIKPDFVGFSVLITLAFDSMKEATNMLEQAGIRDQFKLMIGGGVTTPTLKDYIGADFQTVDATEGVVYCMRTTGGQTE